MTGSIKRGIQYSLFFSFATTCSAIAAPPLFDVNTHCRNIAGLGSNYSAQIDNFCIAQEQEEYYQVKRNWRTYPKSAIEYCVSVSTFGGTGSYELLNYCLKEEVQALRDKPKFKP